MNRQRTHYVTTSDGVTIGGTVHGEGPPLVFLQGAVGDGDLDSQRILGHLTGSHTCYLPSMRGRGLSGDHADLKTSRTLEDFVTYVESIGEPAGLVGWSGGGYFALGVAEKVPGAVAAMALLEPGVLTLMDEAEQASAGAAIGHAAEVAAEGDLPGAVRAFLNWPFTEEDVAGVEAIGYVESAARYVPNMLNFFQQVMQEGYSDIEDPAALGAVTAPVLVCKGSETKPFFTLSAQYVADHVPDARIHEIPGAGHAAVLTHPEPIAKALIEFFAPAQQSA